MVDLSGSSTPSQAMIYNLPILKIAVPMLVSLHLLELVVVPIPGGELCRTSTVGNVDRHVHVGQVESARVGMQERLVVQVLSTGDPTGQRGVVVCWVLGVLQVPFSREMQGFGKGSSYLDGILWIQLKGPRDNNADARMMYVTSVCFFLKGPTSHNENLATGELLEALSIGRQIPRQLPIDPDDAISRYRGNDTKAINRLEFLLE